jgi:hypothetical protein
MPDPDRASQDIFLQPGLIVALRESLSAEAMFSHVLPHVQIRKA